MPHQPKFNGKVEGPRFVTKWINGIWTIFDRVKFQNCEPCLGTEKNATKVLNK